MLPHHGSAHNFDVEIIKWLSKPRLFATVKAGDPKHPHEDVLEHLKDYDLVTEADDTLIREISGPEQLSGWSGKVNAFYSDWT